MSSKPSLKMKQQNGSGFTNEKPDIQMVLERFERNPILKPDTGLYWETKAVFNPAAIYEAGKVHILYRAIGETDVSVLGYASTANGLEIIERLEAPCYVPREAFEGVNPNCQPNPGKPGIYVSGGGGMGGCEDPRLTKIDDRVYMTYVAYDGCSPPRVALTSIQQDNFLNHKWDWKQPVLITRPNIVNKNACILPEKIQGKYVIFHRVFPNILIDFVDDLDFDGRTRWLEGQYTIPVRASNSDWDSLKVGCGAPPLKTKEGWLLIYQAVGCSDKSRYKVGAMLFDLKDPTKILARTRSPILEPAAWYENEGWKSGVVYPCGSVIIKNRLFVYYGGADTVVCVASTEVDNLLARLAEYHHDGSEAIPSSTLKKTDGKGTTPVQGYCMKCRSKQTLKNARPKTLRNLRHTVEGICPNCGVKIVTFIKSKSSGNKS